MKVQASQESVSKEMETAGQPLQRVQVSDTQQPKSHPKKLTQYREMSKVYPQLYGWSLFVDAGNHLYPQDDNIVIYGHNMKNGYIFGTLSMYADKDFFQAHRKMQFDTLYEAGTYEAVAVLRTRILNENEQGFRYYQFFQYDNKKQFQECQKFVEDNRMFETGSALHYGDQILMLSTCEYSQENGRLVVVARKL